MSTPPTLLCALLLCAAPTLSRSTHASQDVHSETASARSETVLSTYSIGGVTAHLSELDDTIKGWQDIAPLRERKAETGGLLGDWARRFVEPAWDLESNSIEIEGGESLTFRGTAQQQAWVAAWLELLKQGELGFVSVSTSIIELPPGGLEVLDFEPDAPMGVATPAQREKLLAAREQLDAHTDWSLLTAPRITTRPFQRGNVSITNQLAYIKEWELTMLSDGRTTVADPVIGTVQEGLGLDLSCGPVAAGVLGLTLSLDRCDVEKPIALRKIRVATNPTTEVDVSTPIVNHVKLKSWYRVPDGGLIYFIVPSSKPDRDMLFLLTVSSTPELK